MYANIVSIHVSAASERSSLDSLKLMQACILMGTNWFFTGRNEKITFSSRGIWKNPFFYNSDLWKRKLWIYFHFLFITFSLKVVLYGTSYKIDFSRNTAVPKIKPHVTLYR